MDHKPDHKPPPPAAADERTSPTSMNDQDQPSPNEAATDEEIPAEITALRTNLIFELSCFLPPVRMPSDDEYR